MRKIIQIVLLSSTLALGLAAPPAAADSWTWRDRSGGRGPLAIESVKAGHSPSGIGLITVTFDRRLRPSRMGPKDFFVLDYEGNGERPSEGWIYVVAENGHLRTFEYNPTTGETYGSIGFERPTPRSLRVVPWNGNQGGFAVAAVTYSENAAAGCSGGCWDFAPNRGYLVHDSTAPTFERFEAPDPLDGFWYEPDVPVSWRATDMGFSGLRRTSIVWRDPQETEWRRLATRSGEGAHEVRVKAVQGAHMLIQGFAEDGAGNTTASYPSELRIPFDDANESGPGTFTGGWTREADAEAMHGSHNVGAGPAAALAFRGTGNLYCVFVRWLDALPARARLQVGDRGVDLNHDATWPAVPVTYCVRTETAGDHDATLLVLAGRVGVDGYWTGDDGTSTPVAGRTGAEGAHLVRTAGSRPSLESLRAGAALR